MHNRENPPQTPVRGGQLGSSILSGAPLSSREVEDAFRDSTGELLISTSAVSEITDRLWEDYQAFISRDLSEVEIEYLFVDAVFESLRRTAPRRRCWSAGRSPPTAPNTCCTWWWATRSPKGVGRNSSGLCSAGDSGCRPP